VTQITTIHIRVRETCAVHFPTYRNKQINNTYRAFNEFQICVMTVRTSVTQRHQQSVC